MNKYEWSKAFKIYKQAIETYNENTKDIQPLSTDAGRYGKTYILSYAGAAEKPL